MIGLGTCSRVWAPRLADKAKEPAQPKRQGQDRTAGGAPRQRKTRPPTHMLRIGRSIRGNTALALHVEDNECATAVLRSHGFRLLDQADISR